MTESTRTYAPQPGEYSLPLHGLAALRILIILAIGLGYASTMSIGIEYQEWGNHWGYDPSWYGIQLLFIFSGFLAARSMSDGRTIVGFFKSRLRSLWPALIAATLVTACFIYPIMCAPNAAVKMSAPDLGAYIFKTVFLIEPGARMPGLLDDAKYMCLLQGAIWTLRIGLILHIGFLLGWTMRILRHPKIVLAMSVLAIAGYVTLVDTAVADPEFGAIVQPALPLFRLGYAYLVGVALFLWQDKLRLEGRRVLLSTIVLALMTAAFYRWIPWSSLLEIMGVTIWLTICLGFLHHAPRAFQRCPRLSPVLYVTIWPAAQIIVTLLPSASQMSVIKMSLLLASLSAFAIFVLLRQARIQPARL